jgi:hypothetical protein
MIVETAADIAVGVADVGDLAMVARAGSAAVEVAR